MIALFAVVELASAAERSLVYADGLHLSTGSIVDPSGRIWVSDHNGGFCRVTDPTETDHGTIEHPVLPGDTQTATCLGGVLPGAGAGPDAGGQPAFLDPSPSSPGNGDEIVLIPDGAAASSEVVRVQWNPVTELFDFKDTIPTIENGDDTRPLAASVGPDGNAYVSFQKSSTIQRIVAPAAPVPNVEVVGTTSDDNGAAAVAAGLDQNDELTVYVAEKVGIHKLSPNPTTIPVTNPSFAVPDGSAISAMVYDLTNDLLYAGTADGASPADAGIDSVHRYNADFAGGGPEFDFADGYSMIGGLGIYPGGNLLVSDDPALLDPADPIGTGRLSKVGPPVAHVGGPSLTSDSTPSFAVSVEPEFGSPQPVAQCMLVGVDADFVECAEDGSYTPAVPLADGDYELAVRALAGLAVGLQESQGFRVDTQAPVITVSPGESAVVGPDPTFELGSDEPATFRCSLDGAVLFTDCDASQSYVSLDDGGHVLRVLARDGLGNATLDPMVRNFTVVSPPAPATPGPPAGPPGGGTPGGGTPPAPLRVGGLTVPATVSSDKRSPFKVGADAPAGASVLEIRVFRLSRAEGTKQSRAALELIAVVVRKIPQSGRYVFRLRSTKGLRNPEPGRYRIEVRAGSSLDDLGPASVRTVKVLE